MAILKLVEHDGTEETHEEGVVEDEAGASDDGLEGLARKRGISVDVLRAAAIGRCPDGRYRGWWRIPYPHRTGLHKYRYNNPDPESQPKYADDTGAKFHLYNPQLLGPGEDEVWFAEGEYDTLALIDQGLKAIGIHGVSNISEKEGETEGRFRKSWVHLFDSTLCITMFDNDDAGRKAGRNAARLLGGEAFDEWPDRYGDINDWHRDDPAGLGEALDSFRYRVRKRRGLPTWK